MDKHPLARWRALATLHEDAWHRYRRREGQQTGDPPPPWTQQRLADSVGVTRETIARIEGGAEPRVRLAVKICEALPVGLSLTPDDVWTADGSEPMRLEEQEEEQERVTIGGA